MQLTDHWFLSDLHLGHSNVLKYDNRPYTCIEQHDRDLTRNCASGPAHKSRTLWLLGDIASRRDGLVKFMDQVKPHWGSVHLIRGNHDDKVAWNMRHLFDEAHESHYLRINKDVRVYLSHYAHRVWRNSHHGSYHLYGHSHGALPGIGRSMDVGANCVDYAPVSMAWVVEQLRDKETINHH